MEMKQNIVSRRHFLRNSALSAVVPSIPLEVLAQTTLARRVEWQTFKTTSAYDSLLSAIRTMKANTNSADPNSWNYWTNIHVNRCPHGAPYFLAWHRGYLYYFERQLRAVAGNNNLVLPYWDYYTSASIPAEFINASTSNPLYVERLNTNVRQALTMAPFSSSLTNFQRGTNNAFEPSIENAPHNPVHDIIGNVMSTMNSPIDPIFWLHHANIDRLWVAWVAAGAGRKMPSKNTGYWNSNHVYSNTLSMPRRSTYDTRTNLQYLYATESFPTALPVAQISGNKFARIQAGVNDQMRTLPPTGSFKVSSPAVLDNGGFSLGGARNIGLDRRSVTAQLPVNAEHWSALQEIARGNTASIKGSARKFNTASLVLDEVEIASAGENGGYFYQVYLNVPSEKSGMLRPESISLGTLGPFQIRGLSHHGHGHAQLRYPIGKLLRGTSSLQLGMVSVSFIRIDGDRSPDGPVIGIGEARLELSSEEAQP